MNGKAPGSIRLLTLIIVLAFAATGISSPLITLYLEELGADYARISLILASFATMALLSPYVWGRLSDHWGRRKPVLLGGLVALLLAYTWLGRASTINAAWMARLLEGVGFAAYMTASLALMGDLLNSEQKRGQRMGSYRGMGSLAFAAGAVTGGYVADQLSLQLAFALCSGLYALATLCALAIREEPVPGWASAARTDSPSSSPAAPTYDRPLPLAYVGGVCLWTAALAAAASMWPNFMARLGYSKSVISSLWGLAALVEAPALHWLGQLSDTAGRVPMLAAGGVGLALVAAGYLFLAQFLPALAGVQVVRGLAYASFTGSAMTFAVEWGQQSHRGSHTGLFNAASGGGQLLGLLLGGTLVQRMGFGYLFGLCSVIALLSTVCFALLRHHHVPARA